MPNTEIRALVDSFTTQLDEILRRMALENVMAALGGVTRRRRPGRPKGSRNLPRAARVARPAKKGGKRTAADLDQLGAKLFSYVQANPGQRGEQIAAALKTDVGTMRLPMQKLMAAKQVRTEGQRRGTMYFPGGRKASAGTRRKPARKGKRRASRKGRAKHGAAKAPAAEAAAAA